MGRSLQGCFQYIGSTYSQFTEFFVKKICLKPPKHLLSGGTVMSKCGTILNTKYLFRGVIKGPQI